MVLFILSTLPILKKIMHNKSMMSFRGKRQREKLFVFIAVLPLPEKKPSSYILC